MLEGFTTKYKLIVDPCFLCVLSSLKYILVIISLKLGYTDDWVLTLTKQSNEWTEKENGSQ